MTQINLNNLSDEVKAFLESLPQRGVVRLTGNGDEGLLLLLREGAGEDDRDQWAERGREIMKIARANSGDLSDEEAERIVADAVDKVRREHSA